jgi:hypothetical protein
MRVISYFLCLEWVVNGLIVINNPRIFRYKMPKTLMMSNLETEPQVNTKGLPNREDFSIFFKSKVSMPIIEMNLEQFLEYKPVEELLSKGLIMSDDVNSLWISNVGDAAGLDESEAYEMLCMTLDLPDPEDLEFLDKAYESLKGKDNKISFSKFLTWSDILEMTEGGVIATEEITKLWREYAGDLNSNMDRDGFQKINNAIDFLIECEEDEAIVSQGSLTSSDFDPNAVFDKESIAEIKEFYYANAESHGIAYSKFLAWDEVQDAISEGLIEEGGVKKLWDEMAKKQSSKSSLLNINSFYELNNRFDDILDEVEAAREDMKCGVNNEEDAEDFYRKEFKSLAQHGLVTLDSLLQWTEVMELIGDGSLTQAQITKMYDGMPKEQNGNISGITEDSFVGFNGMIDVLLDATAAPGSGNCDKIIAAPGLLVAEESPRPMPVDSELKIGSIFEEVGALASKEASDEMDMMEALDQADNLLNSGSFGAFDELIGDINDPRLDASREKLDDESKAELQELIEELLIASREKSRCGLDRPNEVEEQRVRNLVQSVIDKSEKISFRSLDDLRSSINGKWKLLYTNSEMFEFYNGISGFVNIMPSSKFESLQTAYESDGCLSEAMYLEKIETPLGVVDVTVASNWELVKEVSFMTNEDSVVLRAYANKVTAGPFSYEAEENWKSLRTMSMNELVYIDDKVKIVRNCGALRIFFIYERI